mgnify:CR=1 FL=1
MLLRLIKNWTLPLAMLAGTAGYFFFAKIPWFAPVKPCLNGLVALLTSGFDFCTIAANLCKVEARDLKPKDGMAGCCCFRRWRVWLWRLCWCAVQWRMMYREVFEGAMVCLICPTATAAAVITGKLGGSASSLTTYTLLSNLLGCGGCSVGISLG